MPAISDPAILQTKAFAVLVIRICFEFRASDFEFPRLGVVPLIVGPGKACALAKKKLTDYDKTVRPLRDALEEEILNSIPNTELKGHKEQRLANTTNITFRGMASNPKRC
jgi:hypothetical protein